MSEPSAKREAIPSPPEPTTWYLADEDQAQAERRTRRRLILAATIVHLALLGVSLPAVDLADPTEPRKDEQVFVVEPLRFREPVEPPVDVPERHRRRVPVPGPAPGEPQIVVQNRAIDLADDLDLKFAAAIPAPPPSPQQPQPEITEPLRAGSQIERPELLDSVQPAYTRAARLARLRGTVVLEAIIDREGRVRDVKVLSGLPLGLEEEAAKAVGRWRYRPSTVDGQPVEVVLSVKVRFELS